jgi:hypothetical protein
MAASGMRAARASTRRPQHGRAARAAASLAVALVATASFAGCGVSAKEQARRAAATRAYVQRRDHPKLPVRPCSLLTVGQVSAVLGVHVHAKAYGLGCIYMGTSGGDLGTRRLLVQPRYLSTQSPPPAVQSQHPVRISGHGYHGQARDTSVVGSANEPVSANAWIVKGNVYVSLFVDNANHNGAPKQVSRAIKLANEIGRRLHPSPTSPVSR